MKISDLNSSEILKRAKKYIFSTGLNDIASRLCRANMVYGLAKFHLAQENYGLDPSATFISTPDETITRNIDRWENGLGYGGKVSWGSGNEKFIFLDVKPNACGMIVGGLDSLPKPSEILERIKHIRSEIFYLDNIPLVWDFATGNHFIDIFKISTSLNLNLPPYAFIIHCSVPEFKGDNEKGTGLYYNKSKALQENLIRFNTPFGDCKIIMDDNAKEYLNFYKYCEDFSKKKRIIAAKEVFGDFKVIANVIHQGLANLNEIFLGCYNPKSEDFKNFYPLTLRADLPSYIVEGRENFSEEILDNLGFLNRAKNIGVLDRLLKANIFPHGAGYMFPDISSVKDVIDVGGTRYFITEMHNELGYKIFANPRELQFHYRGRQPVINAVELSMINLKAKLIPEFILKV
jgi:hypothetical protein